MLTKDDLIQIRKIARGVLREEVLHRLDKTDQKIGEISHGLASVEFRLADVQDEVSVVAKATNRIEHRLGAANIPEIPDSDGGEGTWLPPFRPSGA